MNQITYLLELKSQIKSYKDFVPLTTDNDSMIKLMHEIHRLKLLIDKIEALDIDQLAEEIDIVIQEKSSKINYIFMVCKL